MKKDFLEHLGFTEEELKGKVGRPKLADHETKKKSIILASFAFIVVVLLLIFGYGTLFGFDKFALLASVRNKKTEYESNVLITDIKPLISKIKLREGTKRKLYLSIKPSGSGNKKISYTSSNEEIARVDDEGRVVGVGVGKAVITAKTLDGSDKEAKFNINVIKNVSGTCDIKDFTLATASVNYNIECDNAKVKEIQYKIGDSDYKTLITKKLNDKINLSKKDLKEKLSLKVIYYPNNSKVTKYTTKKINNTTTTKGTVGFCDLVLKEVKSNMTKYDISCNNASVTKIAYKIGSGSYIGISNSNLADTIIYEESDVTRTIYFDVDYVIDGTKRTKTINKSSIIEKKTPSQNKE